jgi:Ca-activated chloride channel family protein
MNIHPDDPRLTAYVLGELDEHERRAVESAMTEDASVRAEVEQIRAAAAFLTEELAADAPAALTAAQKAAITQAPPRARAVIPFPLKLVAATSAAAAAAAALLLVVTTEGGVVRDVAAPAREERDAPALLEPARAELRAQQGVREAPSDDALLRQLDAIGYANGVAPTPGVPEERLGSNRDSYTEYEEQPFVRAAEEARSTFSIDVDTASYSMVRRTLEAGRRPPRGAVRVEELINYFRYDYPQPTGDHPFSVTTEVASAPWNPAHRLLRIGLQGRALDLSDRRATNLVFLIDVSGSMQDDDKLPLLVRGLSMLVAELDADDRISIVVYAGASGVVLPPTRGDRTAEITTALERLSAGGSTNGGEGIRLAYSLASDSFIRGGVNRVMLATDGDFNVGVTDRDALLELIAEKARTGVFLTVLGFGQGNYQDSLLEQLADRGNGNYAYIDSIAEARRVLVEQGTGTLVTIAKDVKIQVELDPARVESYRLIGYDNRRLANRDFDDDTRDAGEIGAGHTVTALYEIVPAPGASAGSLGEIRLRYKEPDGETSRLFTAPIADHGESHAGASADFRFAAAVASFGMLLRGSRYAGDASFAQAGALAEAGLGRDPDGRRRELVTLIGRASQTDLVE